MTQRKPKQATSSTPHSIKSMDVCQTPPHALEPLYPYIPLEWVVWESAVGPERLIEKTLTHHGYTVIGTDLMYGEEYDRFHYKPDQYDIEITNVPFSSAHVWLEQAFQDAKPFALLMPFEKLARADIKASIRQYHHSPWAVEVLSPERRINFKMPNLGWGVVEWSEKKQKFIKRGESAQMPTVWLTWGLNIHTQRDTLYYIYDVFMRSVKYDENNNPIRTERRKHGISRT